MGLAEFLAAAGEGLSEYGQYQYGRKQDEADAQHRKALLALQEAAAQRDADRMTQEAEQDRLRNVRDSRTELQSQANKQADRLADTGIIVPDSFNQDAMQAGLPDASQAIPDAGSMVLNALQGAGRRGVDRVYQEGPEALNRAMQGPGISEPMSGGGFAHISPSVRASLENAEASRDLAAANRQTLTASQSRTEEEEEAEGLAMLNSPGDSALTQAFGGAFQAARQQNPTMAPGRLAKQVVDGLKQTRPDLFPKAPGAVGATEQILRELQGGGIVEDRPPVPKPAGAGEGIVPTAVEGASLEPDDIARAQRDPLFKAWLEAQGYVLP